MNRLYIQKNPFPFNRVLPGVCLMLCLAGPVWAGDIAVTPEQSIQTALDAAKPGVYHQRVQINNSGTAESPITLRAREPGTVTISGAATERLAFEPVGDGVYAASVPWEVLAVMVDGRKVMSYPSEDDVRRSTVRSQSGPMEGYHWIPADKRLYLRLFASGDPRKVINFWHDKFVGPGVEQTVVEPSVGV